MNIRNLPLKFAFVGLLIVMCVWSLWMGNGLRLGIDLRGGHSLIYEIRTSEAEAKRLEEARKDLEAKLADPNTGQEDRKSAQESLESLKPELARAKAAMAGAGNLAERMISVLKGRVDPQGLRSLEWRSLGRTRIEIRMPAGKEETLQDKNAYIRALGSLEVGNVQRSEIRRLLQAPAEDRANEIRQLAEGRQAVEKLLGELIAANELVQKAQKDFLQARQSARAAAQEALDNAIIEYEKKLEEIDATNVNPQELQAILNNYVSPSEEEAIGNKAEVKALRDRFNKDLQALRDRHPDRLKEIDGVVEAYRKWAHARQRLEDPADLKRLIAKAGVLEFRIAPYAPGTPEKATISTAERDRYVEMLTKEGPDALRRRSERMLWFSIRESPEKYASLVVADYAGKSYVLLYNQPGYMMLSEGPAGWTLADAYPTVDQSQRPAVGFRFDSIGARRFSALTNAQKGNILAILLDDEVYSAPVIKSVISSEGIIEGNFKTEEVTDLVRTLDAGSLPARLNPDPVSESTFGPGIGAENLRMAIRAGYWSCVVVVAFMLAIYLFGGFIADAALMLNILLILGAMSILSAVFTLPGIAGVILSIGMAVDANVLIFERLREEQAKAQSIRMAVKNAYERAFSAIFDSNVTTLLTCVILGWVGTEEVRGFAITLGLGVVFNIFTAVTVTRWLFQLLLETHLLNKPLTMVRLIRVPNVNWMGLRGYFWTFSLITAAMGIASLVWQGSRIWGIEFSAGTQAVIKLRDDALLAGRLPDDGLVRALLREQAPAGGFDKLRDTAVVETVIDRNKADNFLRSYDTDADGKVSAREWEAAGCNMDFFTRLDADKDGQLDRQELAKLPATTYQISTTETAVSVIRDRVSKALGEALQQQVKHTYELVKDNRTVEQLNVAVAADGLTRIEPKLWRDANPTYRDDLADYEGGVMFVLRGINPPISRVEMLQRIRQMRFQPDFPGQQFHRTEVLGLARAGQEGYSSCAVLVAPAEPEMVASQAAWDSFAKTQADLVGAALAREEAMVATNFDPAIAGETAQLAIMALVLSWLSIVAYLWVRFGSIRWGLAAVACIIHDVIIVVGLVAASGWLSQHAIGRLLGIESFKIDLAMVAAVLTLIGYSVNDTIVVFDRIRENRGKLAAVSWTVINDSINQTLSRTLLTGTTTLMVVLIMYLGAGPGIKGFNFALLTGIMFGTYSSIAVASPLLMGLKKAVISKVAAPVAAPGPVT